MSDTRIAQTESQGLCRSASPDELAEVDFRDVVPLCFESRRQSCSSSSHDDLRAYIDHVAGKSGSLSLGYSKAHLRPIRCLDLCLRRLVKSSREIKHVATGEGREARIQMIETRIDEMQRGDAGVPGIGDMTMTLQACPEAVGGPEVISCSIEKSVSFTLEGGLAQGSPRG